MGFNVRFVYSEMAGPDHQANPSGASALEDTHEKTGSLERAYHRSVAVIVPLVADSTPFGH